MSPGATQPQGGGELQPPLLLHPCVTTLGMVAASAWGVSCQRGGRFTSVWSPELVQVGKSRGEWVVASSHHCCYLMTAGFSGALDQTQSEERMRFVMRPVVGDTGQAHAMVQPEVLSVSRGTLERSLWARVSQCHCHGHSYARVSCASVFGCALRDTAAPLPHAGGAQGWWELGASPQVCVTCSI